jgi:hypothetical protein
MPWQSARTAGEGHLETKALDMARRLWNEEPEPVLALDKMREVDEVVEAAKRQIG